MTNSEHKRTVQREFAKQATALAASPIHRDPRRIEELVELAQVGSDDTVLEVACGPGLVLEAVVQRARMAVGVDLTQAMLVEAQRRLASVDRARWALIRADMDNLPLGDNVFDVVISRFSLHHLREVEDALAEMARVARPGGRLAILDHLASDDPAKAAYHNELEIWRDPSHVRVRPAAELMALVEAAGLRIVRTLEGRLPMEFEEWAGRTFQSAERTQRARQMLLDSAEQDLSGLKVRVKDGVIRFEFTCLSLLAIKPTED